MTAAASILAEANRCVACGLCLPACPTYRKTESEADSPRGRVILMRALLDGTLDAEAGLVTHLERCLVCRTCEAICPSDVKYGELIDRARAVLRERHAVHVSGVSRWVPRVFSLSKLLNIVASFRFRDRYPAQGECRGTVALFLGCVSRLADAETLRAAVFVLTRLGYEVSVPRGQGCCGAMHQHSGELSRAEALARSNLEAFENVSQDGSGAVPILFSASGCGPSLVEYGRYGSRGETFVSRTVDIVSFLIQSQGWEGVDVKALSEAVAVHEPCSARNVLRNEADSYRLLERIPQIQLAVLPGNDQCCGAAGLYHLSQPEMAAKLQADKMAAAQASDARFLVSTNFGCARWIARGLRADGVPIKALHPVTLLAKQMGFTGTC